VQVHQGAFLVASRSRGHPTTTDSCSPVRSGNHGGNANIGRSVNPIANTEVMPKNRSCPMKVPHAVGHSHLSMCTSPTGCPAEHSFATAPPPAYVKWACEPARAQDVPAALARGYHLAMAPPQVRVFISVPVDDWTNPPIRRSPCHPRTVSTVIRADPALLDRVAEALAQARRPALVVGAGVDRDHAFAETIALARRHRRACGWPRSRRAAAFRNRSAVRRFPAGGAGRRPRAAG